MEKRSLSVRLDLKGGMVVSSVDVLVVVASVEVVEADLSADSGMSVSRPAELYLVPRRAKAGCQYGTVLQCRLVIDGVRLDSIDN